jgi:hypothetical protein
VAVRAGLTVAVLVAAITSLTAEPGSLTRRDIAAAVAFGETGAARPYLLRHQGRPDNPVVVGAVYTPFLRVALLAQAAADRGERLNAAAVDPVVAAPLVYIAFRWYCCDGVGDADLLPESPPQVLMLPVAPRAPQFVNVMDRRHAVEPVWSRRGTAVLESFGASPPYDDVALVAAFPVGALQAGRPFVIFKDGGSIRTGVVRADDVATWR